MSTFADYLRDRDPLDVFTPGEMNHIILFVYGMLAAAAREGCDAIAFTEHNVTWSRGGLPVMERHQPVHQTMSFRAAMCQIVARDPVVRSALRPVQRDSPIDMDSYQIEQPALVGVATGDDAARHTPTMRS